MPRDAWPSTAPGSLAPRQTLWYGDEGLFPATLNERPPCFESACSGANDGSWNEACKAQVVDLAEATGGTPIQAD